MKTKLPYLLLLLLIASCSGVKQANKALYSGDYERAIDIAVERLQKNKNKKADKEQIATLEHAFHKMKAASLERIDFLKKDVNVNTQEVYNLYINLDNVQKKISPLLPLYKENGTMASFPFEDYSNNIIQAKQDYVSTLYNEGIFLMNGNKQDYRKAYTTFDKLLKIYPNYKDVKKRMDEARFRGTDFVIVIIENNTNQIIPRQLENELLNFNTYGLDDFWTEYHASKEAKLNYDYEVVLEFRELLISPERLSEKQFPLEREITEKAYKKDRSGNYILDQRGNKILEEYRVVVKGLFTEIIQNKAVAISGQVHYFDLNRNQKINTYPLQTEFVFENIFGEFRGDDRVLNNDERMLLKNRFVPFPPNERMLLDASGEIKSRFGAILKRNKF